MSSAVGMLVQNLESSRRLMLDTVRDVSANELALQPSPDLHSRARILGMAATADHEVLRLLGVVNLPDLPEGFEATFARWGTGEEGETEYGDALPEIFASQRSALVRETGALGAADLDEPVDPPDYLDDEAMFRFKTVGEMIHAASAYTSFLAGEASIVGVALGEGAANDLFDRAIAAIKTPVIVVGGWSVPVAGRDG